MKVFVSSTSRDLQQHRDAVINQVHQMGHEVICMEDAPVRSVNGRQSSIEQVGDAHVFVGLIGWRYGTTLPGDTLSITEQEYWYARERGIPTLMFLGTDALRECTGEELDDAPELLARFREHILKEHVKGDFSCDMDALLQAVRSALLDIARNPNPDRFIILRRRRNDRFVGRVQELRALHELLYVSPVRQSDGWHGINPVAIVGMPGSGKTDLALEYLHTRYLAWPGGMFWLDASQSRDSGVSLSDKLTAEAAKAAVRLRLADAAEERARGSRKFIDWLHDRALDTLLVIDDVANPRDLLRATIGDMRIDELGCRVLMTSRHRVDNTCDELVLGMLVEAEAVKVLLRSLPPLQGETSRREEMRAAATICARLGNLPLALDIAAQHLENGRQSVTPSSFLKLLMERGAFSSLSAVQLEMGTDDDDERHPSVLRALQGTWKALSGPQVGRNAGVETGLFARDVLRIAACFPETEPLSDTMLKRASDPTLAESAHEGLTPPLLLGLRRLVDESLIVERPNHDYQLHPLVREFARGADTEPDGERRLDFMRTVAMRYAQALYTPEKIDDMLRGPGGVRSVVRELRMAVELASELTRTSAASHDASAGPGDALSPRPVEVAESWQQTLAVWQHVVEHAVDKMLAVTKDGARAMPRAAGGLRTITTVPLWQQIYNAAVELDATEVCKSVERWLAEAAPHTLWLRLELPAGGNHPALIRTFRQHERPITALAWSPDGSVFASGGLDATVRIWSCDSTVEQATLRRESGVSAVAWRRHPEGGRFGGGVLAASYFDGRVEAWDLSPRDEYPRGTDASILAQVLVSEDAVSALAWSSSGDTLAIGTRGGSLCQWVPDADKITPVPPIGSSIRALAWHPLDLAIACGTRDGKIRLLHGAGTAEHQGGTDTVTTAHPGGVWALAWSRTGDWLASSGEDGTVRLWRVSRDVVSGAPLPSPFMDLAGQYQQVRALAWSPLKDLLAGGDGSGAITVWQVGQAGKQVRRACTIAEAHAGAVRALAWSPDGELLISAGEDGLARVWRTATALDAGSWPVGEAPIGGHERPIMAATWSPNGAFLATVGEDETLGIWNPLDGRRLATEQGQETTRAIAVSPDEHMIATGGSHDRTARVWAADRLMRAGQAPYAPQTGDGLPVGVHQDSVRAVAWSAGGDFLATGSGNVLRIWDAQAPDSSLEPLWRCEGHNDEILALAWHPHPLQLMLASAGRDHTVRVWDVRHITADLDGESGDEPVAIWWALAPGAQSRRGHVGVLAWDPTGRALAAGTDDGHVCIWLVSPSTSLPQTPRLALKAHADAVVALAWRPDSAMFASLGRDRALHLWGMPEGNLLATYFTHSIPLALHWSTDQTHLFVSDVQGPPWHPRVHHLRLTQTAG